MCQPEVFSVGQRRCGGEVGWCVRGAAEPRCAGVCKLALGGPAGQDQQGEDLGKAPHRQLAGGGTLHSRALRVQPPLAGRLHPLRSGSQLWCGWCRAAHAPLSQLAAAGRAAPQAAEAEAVFKRLSEEEFGGQPIPALTEEVKDGILKNIK